MSKPNILVFMTDHQRGDTVLPEHPAIMPTVSKLASEGVTFRETYCPSPHCCPSRATFMSGLYPSEHGVWNNVLNEPALSRGLNEGVRLWSEDLAEAGYEMGYAGKWHVSAEENPVDRGWKEGFVCAKAGRNKPAWKNIEEQSKVAEPPERGEGEILRPGYGTYKTYASCNDRRADDDIADSGVSMISELAASGKPWCMYISINAPHDPYFVPQKYLDMYDLDSIELPPSFSDEMRDKPRVYQRMRDQVWAQLSEREYKEAVRHFYAFCSYCDDKFSEVMAALEATGQADDTLVMYTADHGDYCGEHGLFCKGIPAFRGAYHVPMVMRWPKGIKNPGRSVESFVSLADIGPTILELCGVDAGRKFAGSSLAPFLDGEEPDGWRQEICTQCNGVELYFTQRSITTKTYKYVFNGYDFDELYNLEDDPHEMVNLADNPDYSAVKEDLIRRMWKFARDRNDMATCGYITVGLAPLGPAVAFD